MWNKEKPPKDTNPIPTAIYTRKSHEEAQDQQYTSIEAQRSMCEKYLAREFPGLYDVLPELFDDGGFSGGTLDRPALKRVILAIVAGVIKCLVVYRFDRLSRETSEFYEILNLCKRHGVKLISISEPYDAAQPEGELQIGLSAVIATYERNVGSKRIRENYKAKIEDGYYPSLHRWLGYVKDYNSGKIGVDPSEAEIVRFIFTRFMETESMAKVARECEERGYTTRGGLTRKGKEKKVDPIDQHYVRRILRSPVYAGFVPYAKEMRLLPGTHEPLVSDAEWQKIQEILDGDVPARQGRSRQKRFSWLHGLIFCKACGCHMRMTYSVMKDKSHYRYYVCSKATKFGHSSCPNASRGAEDVEQAVLANLGCIFRTPEVFGLTVNAAQAMLRESMEDAEKRLGTQQQELKDLEEELASRRAGNNAIDRYQSYAVADLQRLSAECRNACSICSRELKVYREMRIEKRELLQSLSQVGPLWDELYEQEKQRVGKMVIRRIMVEPEWEDVEIDLAGLRSLLVELRATHESEVA